MTVTVDVVEFAARLCGHVETAEPRYPGVWRTLSSLVGQHDTEGGTPHGSRLNALPPAR